MNVLGSPMGSGAVKNEIGRFEQNEIGRLFSTTEHMLA